ncbi:hypothetical protein [Hymenobacter canadensis]|uniref:DUF3592 domain-containing protein n=1 Tax=Hymenobacter canadensis TaxID=2999067 RepID=A0ABY7LXG4_9BACT|nr:hypothetical protein [Hymenobacter canadensis]WBA43455.1 hypothetical protein O3303_07770 [Hymenobacter canadensis]
MIFLLVFSIMQYQQHQQQFYKKLNKDGIQACASIENDHYTKGTHTYSLNYLNNNKPVSAIGYSQNKYSIGDSLSILFLPEEDEVLIQE